MSKATIVPDLAYSSRKGRRGNGVQELRRKLKYLTYRNDRDGHIPQQRGKERWHDCGLGRAYGDILTRCDQLGSNSVLAWTWVISPAPDLMALLPAQDRARIMCDLTETIVERYYEARGTEIPEFSYVMHDRLAKTEDGAGIQQLHTHVILPGTVPATDGTRQPFYNRSNKGHLDLLREVSTTQMEAALDSHMGRSWRELRREDEAVISVAPGVPDSESAQPKRSELDEWFPRKRDIEL